MRYFAIHNANHKMCCLVRLAQLPRNAATRANEFHDLSGQSRIS
jgi:hypothetical protein